MSKIFNFGETVKGYKIPVLNEREIRAAAGILFVFIFISIMQAAIENSFTMIKYFVTFFLTDIAIRVLINPKYSPSLIIGRWIVRNQVPEYVGAAQKKFAWIIGLFLAAIMFVHLVVINAYSPISGITCMICLIFLFFETSFGICLGCAFYKLFYKQKAQYCPGEVCDVKSRQPIQKISPAQTVIVLGFIAYIFLIVGAFNNKYIEKPYDIFGISKHFQTK